MSGDIRVTPSPDIPDKEIRERCADILSRAAEEARRLGHNYIGAEHLFMACTRSDSGAVSALLRRAGDASNDHGQGNRHGA